MKLNAQGVKAYKVESGSVAQNLESLKRHELPEFSINNSCNHHNCGH